MMELYDPDKYYILKLAATTKGIKHMTPEAICELAKGQWRINPTRLFVADKALVVYKRHVLLECRVGSSITFHRDERRISFDDLTIVPDSEYVGRRIDHVTPNPATILDRKRFKFEETD